MLSIFVEAVTALFPVGPAVDEFALLTVVMPARGRKKPK